MTVRRWWWRWMPGFRSGIRTLRRVLLEATDLVRAYVDETLDVCDDFDAPIEIFELIS